MSDIATLWTVSLCHWFFSHEYCNEVSCPPPGIFSNTEAGPTVFSGRQILYH